MDIIDTFEGVGPIDGFHTEALGFNDILFMLLARAEGVCCARGGNNEGALDFAAF